MKRERDIAGLFHYYSGQMLPKDGELFMEKLKQNMNRLPVPSTFNEMDAEMSKEYAEWLIKKMKKDYARARKDAVLLCIFAIIAIGAVFSVISILGLLDINMYLTLGILVGVAFASIGILTSSLFTF